MLELCRRKELPNYGMWAALRGLGVADKPEVRSYLLERLKKEQNPGCFMSAAQALGELKEPSGVEIVGQQLLRFQEQWSGVEVHLMSAMSDMDATKAVPWFRKYLADEKSQQLHSAIYSINKVEPELAKKAATDLINNRSNIAPTQLSRIRHYIK